MAIDLTKRIEDMLQELQTDEVFNNCANRDEDSEWRVFKKYSKKYLDSTWLDIVEETMPCLETIVRNPRKFIQSEEELVETSRAKTVSMGTVKFLAQHTQFIQGIEDDNVIPSKVLNTNREESFQIYENRFIYTLIKKLNNFIRVRFDALQSALNNSEQLEVVVEKTLEVGEDKTSLRLDGIIKLPGEHIEKLEGDDMTPLERLVKIRNSLTAMMTSNFAKEMSKSEPVRPPITRTNVILKNHNFKQSLVLWEFLQGYNEEGVEVRSVNETEDMNDALKNEYALIVYLNNLFLHKLMGEIAPTDSTVGTSALDPGEGKENTVNYDDFPKSNIDVEEIKTISPGFTRKQEMSAFQRNEITSAIDRTLAQYRLNIVADKTKLKAKLILEQRRKEKAYRDKQAKIRKKERQLLEQQARQEEKMRLREENENRRRELEERKVEKKAILQEKKLQEEARLFEQRQKKLDDVAVRKAKAVINEKNNFENKNNMTKDVLEANSLRVKLKRDYAKLVDKNVDAYIKEIYKAYKK